MDALSRPLCPCCRRPLDQDFTAKELTSLLRFPPNSSVTFPVLGVLARAWPRSVLPDTLVELVYALRPNGEPDCGMKSVAVAIVHLRRRLAPYGWTISDARQRDGYRLERVG